MSTKQIQIGVVMDPIQSIKPAKDTTLAMLLAAQGRGWTLFYMEQADIYLSDGKAHARMQTVTVRDHSESWFELGAEHDGPLDRLDVVLMRKDPPFDMEYIYTTYLLERAEAAGLLVVNRPAGLRDVSEKVYTAWFPQCCPATLISRSMKRIRHFLAEHGKIVIKPLGGMGGESVFVLAKDDPNLGVALETLTQRERRFALAQQYIPEISAGDKRILLIDGTPIPHALARLAAPGESRGNLAAGGRGEGVELTERDRWICAQVGPKLREKGILFAGLDVIGDYLTEINVTSPTCIRELDRIYGLNISSQLLDTIEARLARR